MSDDTSTSRGGELDERTRALIEQAHQCGALPNIDDCLPYLNLGHMLSVLAGQQGNAPWMTAYPCLESPEEPSTYSYSQFSDMVNRAAMLLAREYGIGPGRTVAIAPISQAATAVLLF